MGRLHLLYLQRLILGTVIPGIHPSPLSACFETVSLTYNSPISLDLLSREYQGVSLPLHYPPQACDTALGFSTQVLGSKLILERQVPRSYWFLSSYFVPWAFILHLVCIYSLLSFKKKIQKSEVQLSYSNKASRPRQKFQLMSKANVYHLPKLYCWSSRVLHLIKSNLNCTEASVYKDGWLVLT